MCLQMLCLQMFNLLARNTVKTVLSPDSSLGQSSMDHPAQVGYFPGGISPSCNSFPCTDSTFTMSVTGNIHTFGH